MLYFCPPPPPKRTPVSSKSSLLVYLLYECLSASNRATFWRITERPQWLDKTEKARWPGRELRLTSLVCNRWHDSVSESVWWWIWVNFSCLLRLTTDRITFLFNQQRLSANYIYPRWIVKEHEVADNSRHFAFPDPKRKDQSTVNFKDFGKSLQTWLAFNFLFT